MKLKRNSYSKITQQTHPLEKKYTFSDDSLLEVSKFDSNIFHELFELINKIDLFKTGTGEWKYLETNKRKNFIKNLQNKNFMKLRVDFTNFFRNDISYGLSSPSYEDCFKPISEEQNQDNINLISKILCDIDTCVEFTDLSNLSQLFVERSIGNVYGLCVDDKVIHPDFPRHYYYAHKIKSLIKNKSKCSILEIGGGFGSLTRFLFEKISGLTYYGIDLTPSCLVQFYYLRKLGYKVNMIFDIRDIKPGEINLIPYDKSSLFIKSLVDIDIVFNSRSFCEMGLKTVNNYFEYINDFIKPNFIYHENSNYLLFPNSERHIEVLGSDFPINYDLYELNNMSITPFSGGNGRYREFVYKLKKSN